MISARPTPGLQIAGDIGGLLQPTPDLWSQLAWVSGALFTLALAASLLATFTILLVRRREDRRAAWAREALPVLSQRGATFAINRRNHLRGMVGGRPCVLTYTHSGRAVAVATLFLPAPGSDPTDRPDLRHAKSPRGQRLSGRFVQVWSEGLAANDAPKLLAEAITLARAQDEQTCAPWAQFAAERGLRFRASRGGEHCSLDGEWRGTSVHVQLEGAFDPPLRTVLVAALPKVRFGGPRVRGNPGESRPLLDAMGARALTPGLLEKLDRYPDAVVEETTVRIRLEGMVIEDLDKRLDDLVDLSLALHPPLPPA